MLILEKLSGEGGSQDFHPNPNLIQWGFFYPFLLEGCPKALPSSLW